MMEDLPTLLAAIGGLMTPLGAGLTWGYKEIKMMQKELMKCEEGRALDRVVIELLWQVVKSHDPNNPVLERAKSILDEIKQLS